MAQVEDLESGRVPFGTRMRPEASSDGTTARFFHSGADAVLGLMGFRLFRFESDLAGAPQHGRLLLNHRAESPF